MLPVRGWVCACTYYTIKIVGVLDYSSTSFNPAMRSPSAMRSQSAGLRHINRYAPASEETVSSLILMFLLLNSCRRARTNAASAESASSVRPRCAYAPVRKACAREFSSASPGLIWPMVYRAIGRQIPAAKSHIVTVQQPKVLLPKVESVKISKRILTHLH